MSVELSASGVTVTPQLKTWLNANGYMPTKDHSHTAYQIKAAEALINEDLDSDTYMKLTKSETENGTDDMKNNPTPDEVFSGNKSANQKIRVKAPSEGLDDSRYAVKHSKTGKPVCDEFGRECSSPSEKSTAQAGVLMKLSARKSGIDAQMSDWEKALLDEMTQTEQWASFGGDAHENNIIKGGSHVKALLDDAPSGGLELAPITFDNDIITQVLLTGELLPNVTIKPVSRGRRVEGASVSHPTVNWGTAEGTDGSLQDFSTFVSSVDTTIYPGTCFCEVGRDFLSDSAVDVGSHLVGLISEAMSQEMEDVIADGNGSTQPEGIMQKSGTTSVAWGGATSIGNYESMLFAVPKQWRKNPANSFAFCGNETSYSRMRAMSVGASDARRLFGLNHESYECFPPRKYLINETLGNTEVFAGDLKRYRLYKRLGLQTQWSTEGKSLTLANTALLSVRFRYGGQVTHPAAFAKTTTAPA